MTITIELPEELATRLAAASISPDEARRYAVAALTEAAARAEVDAPEVQSWWDGLSDDEQAAERTKTRDSLAEADAGQSRSLAEVCDRIREKPAADTPA